MEKFILKYHLSALSLHDLRNKKKVLSLGKKDELVSDIDIMGSKIVEKDGTNLQNIM